MAKCIIPPAYTSIRLPDDVEQSVRRMSVEDLRTYRDVVNNRIERWKTLGTGNNDSTAFRATLGESYHELHLIDTLLEEE